MKTVEETIESEGLIRSILENSKDTITANIKEALKKQITDQLGWTMREHISKVTNEFVEAELKDEIKKVLVEAKPEILESIKGSFIKIGAAVATSMYETAAKNLAVGSYHAKDIFKKLID